MGEFSYEWKRGRFRSYDDNEVALEDLPNDSGDPPKWRFAARMGKALGCLSWNRLRPDDRHNEVALGIGKAVGANDTGGMLDWFVQDPNVSGDMGMKRIMEWFHDRVKFHVPVEAPNLTSSTTPPNELRHPNGRHWLVLQGDGNFVAYRNRVDFDYSTGEPYWSSGTINP